jgi:hypothetical protein
MILRGAWKPFAEEPVVQVQFDPPFDLIDRPDKLDGASGILLKEWNYCL